MLPMYRRVAKESPHGQGSVAMLERLLPFWRGKIFVLVLLGFVATSWIITITLSSADATVHLLENPFARTSCDGQAVPITIVLLLILGGVFLLGFTEAVNVAIPLVAVFLAAQRDRHRGRPRATRHRPGARSTDWLAALTSSRRRLRRASSSRRCSPSRCSCSDSPGSRPGVSMMPLVASKGATPEERLRLSASATPRSCSPPPRSS